MGTASRGLDPAETGTPSVGRINGVEGDRNLVCESPRVLGSGVVAGELTEGDGAEKESEVAEGDVPEPAGEGQGDDDHA